MKIKFIAVACIALNIFSLSERIEAEAVETVQESVSFFDYLPITDYQKSLTALLCNFTGSCTATKEEFITTPLEITQEEKNANEQADELSRQDTLEAMRIITSKIFDISDPEHVGSHLLAMKKLGEYLDSEDGKSEAEIADDRKTIAAINFLLENQHRSSLADTVFWWQANTKYDLSNAIPMTPEVAKNTANATTLRKKMAAQKIKKDPIKDIPVTTPVVAGA